MKNFMQVFVCIVTLFQVCDAQKRNFTMGSNIITASRLQEKTNDYSQCYVDVVVHNSSSFKYGLKNAEITALSLDSGAYKYSCGLSDVNGHVCLPVLCRKDIRVFVEKNTIRISALNKTMQQRNIPRGFSVTFETNNEVILFYAYSWGTVAGRSGPVYSAREKYKCTNAKTSDYHFVFSYILVPDRLLSTFPPPVDANNPLDPNFPNAWRYGFEGSNARDAKRTCFFKIKVKTSSTEVKIRAYSKLYDANGVLYGLFETGPKYDVNAANFTDKAACVEFRCPAVDIIQGFEMSTFIEGNIQVPGKPNGCCAINRGPGNIFNVNHTSFTTVTPITSTNNYGSKKGIYIHNDPEVARAKCFTGREFLGSEYAMNVSTGYVFVYDCLQDQHCNPEILGK